MTSKTVVLVGLCLLAATTVVRAESPRCPVAEFKDSSNYSQKLRDYLAIVNTTDQSNFEQRKSELNIGGQGFIKGVPFKLFADWSDFRSRKTEILTSFNYKLTVDQDTSYLETRVTEHGRAMYKDCLTNGYGLDVVATHQSANDVTFRILWNPNPREEKVTHFEIFSSGGAPISKNIPPSGRVSATPEMPMVFHLTPNKPFHLMVTTVPTQYSRDVDYIIPKFKTCRLVGNGLDRNDDGSDHITHDVQTFHDMNARYVDYNRAWATVYQRLVSAGHKNIQKVSQSEVDGHDSKNHKIDRDFTFEVTYDPLYREEENLICGLEVATAEAPYGSS